MSRPRLLDGFCGAGGAAMGYARVGFDVNGIDKEDQPHYPFAWFPGDFFRSFQYAVDLWRPAAIHVSPPCQGYLPGNLRQDDYPRLIGPVRDVLEAWGGPYVIENVEGARSELRNPFKLCGSSFGLGVRRHRYFETNFPVDLIPPCAHHLQPEPIDVTGTGGSRSGPRPDGKGGNSRKPRNLAHAREVMGIEWMSREELAEAIPPAYTGWIGAQLLKHLRSEVAA